MYCSKCGQEIDESGKFCKHCGARLEHDPEGTPSEGTPLPPAEQREDIPTYEVPRIIRPDMMEKGEKVVFETHPSKMGAFFNHIATAVVLVVLGFFLLIRFNWSIFAAIPIFVAVIVFLVGYLKWRSVTYVLTTKRILVLKGVLDKELYENRLSKVQDIRMKMTVRQRMYNCGDIYLTTAGTSAVECMWQNIPDPRRKEALLRKLVTE
ncbi:MAG: PH domain-containing protein [Dehalococcoidia bacterium]